MLLLAGLAQARPESYLPQRMVYTYIYVHGPAPHTLHAHIRD